MTAAVSRLAEPAADAAITAAAKTLQLPTIRAQAGQLAAAAAKQRLSHKAFLAEVLTAECDERDARRRIRLVNEAKFPRTKRLADFDHTRMSGYDLTCRSGYDLTCRSRQGDHVMGSPPATRVRRSLRR
jgi:IstB-like ATP binding protein